MSLGAAPPATSAFDDVRGSLGDDSVDHHGDVGQCHPESSIVTTLTVQRFSEIWREALLGTNTRQNMAEFEVPRREALPGNSMV